MIIIGMGALARADGAAMLGKARQIAETYGVVTKDWNGFNVLHNAAARVGGLDLGFVPGRGGMDVAEMAKAAKAGELDLVWLLGADELDLEPFAASFVVYQGIMVMQGRIMRIWCCQVPPTPKKMASMSTLKAVSNMQAGLHSRPVMRAKIGQLFAPFLVPSASQSALTRWQNCVRLYVLNFRILPMLMRLRRRNGRHLAGGQNCLPSRLVRRSIISI